MGEARLVIPVRIGRRRRLGGRGLGVRAEQLNGLVIEVQRLDRSAARIGSETRDRVRLLANAARKHSRQRMLEQPTNLPALASEECSAKHVEVSEQADSAVDPT